MTDLQAILFKKSHYSKRSSANWLKYHGFKPIKKVHETVNYYRYRLKEPDEEMYYYRLVPINNGIKMVFQFTKYSK
jgi:hypothetical protein